MDWKQLVQFTLQGSGELEQFAILLVRVSIGLFFAISGANKRAIAGGTKPFTIRRSLKPRSRFLGRRLISVAGVEFVGGSPDRRASFDPGLCGINDRYDCRHPDQRGFHSAKRTFSPLSQLDDFPLTCRKYRTCSSLSGSSAPVRESSCGLPARRGELLRVIDR